MNWCRGMRKKAFDEKVIAEHLRALPKELRRELHQAVLRLDIGGALDAIKRIACVGPDLATSVEVETPDLILLDVQIPDMDGYEICRRLKNDVKNLSISVIFMSALCETADKIKGFEAGGVDYITKPFQQMDMLKRIETHLGIARPAITS